MLAATDGAVAFDAVFAAVDAGIDVAVANKELIVAAGELLFRHAKAGGARLLPVDSEHSAIFQCVDGEPHERIAGIVLTASGGPFWDALAPKRCAMRSVADALSHPTWQMGVKNTIDSATLMNKGLEVIEASRFFDLPAEKIHVLVHRTSVAHGFAIFTDGNVVGQFAPPDMRLPIGYALAYPDRLADRDRQRRAGRRSAAPPARKRRRWASSGRISSGFRVWDSRTARSRRAVRLRPRSPPRTKSPWRRSSTGDPLRRHRGVHRRSTRCAAAEELSLDAVRAADRFARERANPAVAQRASLA